MNRIAIELGPINIYWYSITILLAILIASFIFFKLARKEKYTEEFITNLVFYGTICGIIGARIYYVLFNLDYYLANPLEIVAIWNGGLAIHGGIIGGAIWFIYYSKKHHKNFLKIFDLAAPALIIGQAIGRWGNFFNSEAHGPKVSKEALEKIPIPDFIVKGMHIGNSYYHPTFFYESIWCLLGFIILITIIIKYRKKIKTGLTTGIYFIWYSSCRFFIEGMRTDSLMIGDIKIAQVVSILLITIGIYLVVYKKKYSKIIKLIERNVINEKKI